MKYDATYRVTSVDPPELVRFIKNQHPDVKREVPRDRDGNPITMWNLIPRKMLPPTRLIRYCCTELKESGGDGRMTLTGVRWAESVKRKQNQGLVTFYKKPKELTDNPKFSVNQIGGAVLVNDNTESRNMVEQCYRRNKTTVNPIIDWTDTNVWDFIHEYNIPYCSLYDEGFQRIGCIGCPMAGKRGREREFARYPKYKDAYLRAFDKMLQERKRRGKLSDTWRMGTTAQDVFNWWMEYDVIQGQINLFDEYEEIIEEMERF